MPPAGRESCHQPAPFFTAALHAPQLLDQAQIPCKGQCTSPWWSMHPPSGLPQALAEVRQWSPAQSMQPVGVQHLRLCPSGFKLLALSS